MSDHSITSLIVGDRVTNGAWIGTVLATYQDSVWVIPTKALDGCQCTKDGPLTFRQGTLSRAQSEAPV